MLRPWRLGASLVVMSSFLIPVSRGTTEDVMASLAVPMRWRNAAEVDAVYEVAVGLAEPRELRSTLPARSAQPAAVQVMEPSRQTTLEELRRGLYLYPDHDLTARLLEYAAERRPLFGENA